MQSPNRLERASEREVPILEGALAKRCRECGADVGVWCYRVGGEWTLHGSRILNRNAKP